MVELGNVLNVRLPALVLAPYGLGSWTTSLNTDIFVNQATSFQFQLEY